MISSDPALQPLITAALAGVTDPRQLYLLTPQRRLIVATPVAGPGRRVAGLAVAAGRLPPASSSYGNFLSVLGTSLVLFLLGAGTLGTVFGFLLPADSYGD